MKPEPDTAPIRITLRVRRSLWRRIKVHTVEREQRLQVWVAEAIAEALRKTSGGGDA